MPWPVHPTGFFGARGDNDTYRIERSLRFNSADSAYLNRTPASAGNRKTWTWSGWVKRGLLGIQNRSIFISNPAGTSDATNTEIRFGTSLYLDSLAVNGYSTNFRITTQVFRDVSAWYHIVVAFDTTQATGSDRIKIYVNGSQVTSFVTSSDPTQNTDYGVNQSQEHRIGYSSGYFDGYLTEINFIDGQALTPSSFGETDAITGRWKAKAYSGTYGTNGFYLKFADNSGTTSTTLGKDSSPNGNNWTPNNFSVTAGAGNDSLVDSPTNYGTDSGVGGEVRGNYATLNVVDRNSSISLVGNGNLEFTQNSNGTIGIRRSTIGITSGKWYFEAVPANVTAFSTQHTIGIIGDDHNLANYVGSGGNGYAYRPDANKLNNGTATSYGTTTTANTDVIMVAFDADNWKIWFGKNGTWFASGDPVAGTNTAFSSITGGLYYFAVGSQHTGFGAATWVTNFGQRPFAYTAPSGFKALCTTNLTQPTIQKPSKYMDVVAYTGTGASNSISSLGFSPDLVWIKNRGAATSHAIYDTTRGVQNQLSSDTTGDAVTSSSGLTAFGSNGFTIGTSSLVNTSGTQYVAWAWDEAPIAGMDIVSYTGTGAIRTVAHNLGVAPKMIIAKLTNSAGFQWPVYHSSLTSASSYIWLNSTNAQATDAAYWGTAPTSSVFSVGTNANVNNNTSPYIAYLFAEVEGFSKFGSYTGNGSADGPFVWCGFRPRWVMVKLATSTGESWYILDTQRDLSNATGRYLSANLSGAEDNYTATYPLDIVSNGFKLRNATYPNASSQTYIFAAFAESPFKYARAR
jgi:hypothetical protein